MDCKTIEKKLIFYLGKELPEDEIQGITSHIEGCASCASKLEFMKDAMQWIDTEKAMEVKPFLITRILARMEQTAPAAKRWILAPLAIASVLTVGLFFGTLVSTFTINKTDTIAQANYDVAYIFNDAQIESAEYKLLNE